MIFPRIFRLKEPKLVYRGNEEPYPINTAFFGIAVIRTGIVTEVV